jgi:hypothetical protein
MKYQGMIPMTPSRIQSVTFQLVAQCLNQQLHHPPPVPRKQYKKIKKH